jgi:hypothetical protein
MSIIGGFEEYEGCSEYIYIPSKRLSHSSSKPLKRSNQRLGVTVLKLAYIALGNSGTNEKFLETLLFYKLSPP